MLAGCAVLFVRPIDVVGFKPKSAEDRVMNNPRVSIIYVDDIDAFCKRKVGMMFRSGQRYMACAQWFTDAEECRIYISHRYAFEYLGHELRHCFEGHFH